LVFPALLKKFSKYRFRGIFHCFGGGLEEVQKIQQVGDFKFGIGGIVTFKNASLPAIIPHIGLENIVLETDGPYLAPVPFRGTRNEPAYILDIALKIADILGLSLLEIEKQTQLNVQSVFRK
jgi:TatD DNase family protein